MCSQRKKAEAGAPVAPAAAPPPSEGFLATCSAALPELRPEVRDLAVGTLLVALTIGLLARTLFQKKTAAAGSPRDMPLSLTPCGIVPRPRAHGGMDSGHAVRRVR